MALGHFTQEGEGDGRIIQSLNCSNTATAKIPLKVSIKVNGYAAVSFLPPFSIGIVVNPKRIQFAP